MKEILYVGQVKCPIIEDRIGNLICCKDEDVALDIIKRHKIQAVIEDGIFAKENHFSLVADIIEDPVLSHIPVIGFLNNVDDELITNLLEEGFCDVLYPPFSSLLLQKRIVNSIKSAGSVTFDEMAGMLRELPSNIYLKDAKGRYIFATHYWDHIKHEEPNFSIRGKTDLDIRKNRENAMLAMAADRRILKTGHPEQYIIEEDVKDGKQYLELIKCPVKNSIGQVTGIVGLINDVTQMELLRMQLEEQSQKDALTGLYNKDSIKKRIEETLLDVSRGVFFMMDLDNFKGINDAFGHNVGDNVLAIVGDLLKLGFEDGIVGRFGGDEFIAFVSDIGVHEANQIAKAFCKQVKSAFGGKLKGCIGTSVGLCAYPDGGNSFKELYEKADEALYIAKKDGKGTVKDYDK